MSKVINYKNYSISLEFTSFAIIAIVEGPPYVGHLNWYYELSSFQDETIYGSLNGSPHERTLDTFEHLIAFARANLSF